MLFSFFLLFWAQFGFNYWIFLQKLLQECSVTFCAQLGSVIFVDTQDLAFEMKQEERAMVLSAGYF